MVKLSKILVCNQKMFLTLDEAILLKNEMDGLDFDNIDLIVCPNYLNMQLFSNYKLCSQDSHYEDKGAFTSKVSAYDLSLRGIKYSLVGHSDIRDKETDKEINLKVKALLKHSMTPILCIGETKYDKELMKTSFVLKKELTNALKDINLDNTQEVYIAYEPRYLISGKNALAKKDIIDIFLYIRKILSDLNINKYKLLYGAAVNSENIKDLVCEEIDGFLLGASSVNISELKSIIKCLK